VKEEEYIHIRIKQKYLFLYTVFGLELHWKNIKIHNLKTSVSFTEGYQYCTWLQLVDVWVLLHVWHIYTSKCVFLITAVAALLAIRG
jgi:hypothetical protein